MAQDVCDRELDDVAFGKNAQVTVFSRIFTSARDLASFNALSAEFILEVTHPPYVFFFSNIIK